MTNPLETLKNWYLHSSPKKKALAGLALISLVACGALLLSSGGTDGAAGGVGDSPFYYLGVMLKLVGVLLLIVGGAVMLLRWQKAPRKGFNARRLAREETIRLTPKQAVHLIRVGDQHFLIGATDQSVSLISAVDLPVEENAPAIPVGLDFSQLLQNVAGQGGSDRPAGLERNG